MEDGLNPAGRVAFVVSSNTKRNFNDSEDEATQSQHMPQVPSSSFVGGGSIPANGMLESTPFRFQGGNLNERLPTRIISQPQPSPSLTGINDQSSHGELVKKHTIVSDLLKVGQLPKRSGLKTEIPLDNQELERVQRSHLRDMQDVPQPPHILSVTKMNIPAAGTGSPIMSTEGQHYPSWFDDSGSAPSYSSSSSLPSSSMGLGSLGMVGYTDTNTEGNTCITANDPGNSSVPPAPGTGFKFIGSAAELPLYPVCVGIPEVQQPAYQRYQPTHSYSYQNPAVQALYHLASPSMLPVAPSLEEDPASFIIVLEPDAQRDCAICAYMKNWISMQHDGNKFHVNSQIISPPPLSPPPSSSSMGISSLELEMLLDQVLSSYMNEILGPQEGMYQRQQAITEPYPNQTANSSLPPSQGSASGSHMMPSHPSQWGTRQQY